MTEVTAAVSFPLIEGLLTREMGRHEQTISVPFEPRGARLKLVHELSIQIGVLVSYWLDPEVHSEKVRQALLKNDIYVCSREDLGDRWPEESDRIELRESISRRVERYIEHEACRTSTKIVFNVPHTPGALLPQILEKSGIRLPGSINVFPKGFRVSVSPFTADSLARREIKVSINLVNPCPDLEDRDLKSRILDPKQSLNIHRSLRCIGADEKKKGVERLAKESSEFLSFFLEKECHEREQVEGLRSRSCPIQVLTEEQVSVLSSKKVEKFKSRTRAYIKKNLFDDKRREAYFCTDCIPEKDFMKLLKEAGIELDFWPGIYPENAHLKLHVRSIADGVEDICVNLHFGA